jgi:hypothetical protein
MKNGYEWLFEMSAEKRRAKSFNPRDDESFVLSFDSSVITVFAIEALE